MRILFAAVLALACGCAGQQIDRVDVPDPTTGISAAEAERLVATHFQTQDPQLRLIRQKLLVEARLAFRKGLTALAQTRFDVALRELERAREIVDESLRDLPLDAERRQVRRLVLQTRRWRVEAQYRKEMLLREEARLRALRD